MFAGLVSVTAATCTWEGVCCCHKQSGWLMCACSCLCCFHASASAMKLLAKLNRGLPDRPDMHSRQWLLPADCFGIPVAIGSSIVLRLCRLSVRLCTWYAASLLSVRKPGDTHTIRKHGSPCMASPALVRRTSTFVGPSVACIVQCCYKCCTGRQAAEVCALTAMQGC